MIDKRAARALLAVRELLRSVAAADQQAEQARRARALAECAEAMQHLSAAYDRATEAMLAAPTVEALALAAHAPAPLRLRADELTRTLREADHRVERASFALRERNRQAHGATRLAEKVAHHHSQRERRLEQLQHDDLPRRGPMDDGRG